MKSIKSVIALSLAIAAGACSDSSTTAPVTTGFLAGTADNHEIGVVVNSLDKALTLFQLGSPTTQQKIPLGASSAITPTGLSLRGKLAAVPLGNTASVALIDLSTSTIRRYYTFTGGNTTGSAFADDTTLIVANTNLNLVGRVTTGQAGDAITQTVTVAAQPTAIQYVGGRALVVSSNLGPDFITPLGNGVVTALDPKTLKVLGTVQTGGIDATDAAVGPDGLLYVINTGDYVGQGSLTIIDPATMTALTTIQNIGVGPGAISIDANGLAYISEFATGTVVWNTKTRTFVRGVDNPVCAKIAATGACRGAFASTASANGKIYQLFFGDSRQGLAPYAFVFSPTTFALTDSVSVGTGPSAIAIRTF